MLTPQGRARFECSQTVQQLERLRPLARKFIAQAAQSSLAESFASSNGGSITEANGIRPHLEIAETLGPLSGRGHP